MPLLAGVGQPTLPPVQAPARQPKQIIWTAPDGDEITLTDTEAGYTSLPGRSGFGLPPREVVYDALPDGGGVLRSVHDQVRVIAVPLLLRGPDQETYLERYRRLQRAFRHRRGGVDVPGTLTVELPDGTRRSIQAFYNGGLDPVEDVLDDLLGCYQFFPNLEFLALDPYWVGDEIEFAWGSSDTTVPWFSTMPLHLSASQVLGSVTADLPGDADSYPIWTITGPGTPLLANDTTGRSLAFRSTFSIPAGTVVTIDTRPDQLLVVDDQSVNLFGELEPFPDLWTLEPGVNELRVEMAGATSASRVEMRAAVRWQAGW